MKSRAWRATAFTSEIRAENDRLQTEFRDAEGKYRAAVIAEAATERRAATDGEGAELRRLLEGASLGMYFQAALERRATAGREAELQSHFKLAGNQFPLEMLRERVEHRAVTAAPTNTGESQAAIVQPIFARGDGAFLRVSMPTVAVGDSVYPVLTSRPTVGGPHTDSTEVAETTGSFDAEVLTPSRLQASFFYRRTDAARFAGMAEALRMSLSAGLGEAMDKQVISQIVSDVTRTAASASDTFQTYRQRLIYGRIDGRFARQEGDLSLLVGPPTLAHQAGLYRANNADDSAADVLRRLSGGLRVSALIPAVAGDKQDALIRRGAERDMVAPVWRGVSLIPDEVTLAGKGEIKVTAVLLAAFKVVRTAGFARVQTQHA